MYILLIYKSINKKWTFRIPYRSLILFHPKHSLNRVVNSTFNFIQSENYVSPRVALDRSFLLTATGNLAQIKIYLIFDLSLTFTSDCESQTICREWFHQVSSCTSPITTLPPLHHLLGCETGAFSPGPVECGRQDCWRWHCQVSCCWSALLADFSYWFNCCSFKTLKSPVWSCWGQKEKRR